MISKWARWLGKMQRPYTLAWNEKHVLFAFCINMVQLLDLSTMVSPDHTCQRCMCLQVTDLQSWGRWWTAIGRTQCGLWGRVRISGAQRAQILWRTGSATSGAACDTAGTWVVFPGSLCRACVQYPKQLPCLHVKKAAWFRKSPLFRESA